MESASAKCLKLKFNKDEKILIRIKNTMLSLQLGGFMDVLHLKLWCRFGTLYSFYAQT